MAELRDAVEAATTFFSQHPERARVTLAADCEVADGTAVAARVGPHLVKVDLARRVGGHGAAPSPEDLAMIAMGSCMAITYQVWARRLDLHIDTLWVEVRADLDTRGFLGVDDGARHGFDEVRVVVHISGPEPAQRLKELRSVAEARSGVLDLFRTSVPVTTRLEVDD